MRTTLAAGLLVLCSCAVQPEPEDAPARVAQELGEPVLTDAGFVFPSWEERVIYTLTNRARTDPQKQQGECIASPGNPYLKCPWDEAADGGCYTPQQPLVWDLGLSQSARFHATYLSKGGLKLGHDNCCTLRTDVATSGCDGDPACACVTNTQAGTCAAGCTGAITTASARVAKFASGYSGEIAHQFYSDPLTIFHGWVDENLGASTCSFGGGNGHRWLILKNTGPRIGAGQHKTATASCNSPYWVEDFGGAAAAIPRIPGAVHHPKAGTPTTQFTFWANWYHAGGAAPTRSAVVVNGNCRPMSLDFGTVQNGSYKATGTVPAGCQPYYFLFVDSAGTRVTYPTVGSMTISSTTACANDYVATQAPADCEGAGGGAGGGGGGSGGGSGSGGGAGGSGGGSGTGGGSAAGGGGGAGGGTSGAGGGAAGAGGGTSGAGGGSTGAGGGTSGAGGGTTGAGGGTSGAGGGSAGAGGGTTGAGGGSGPGGGMAAAGGGGATTTTGGCGCSSGGDLLFPLLTGLALIRRQRSTPRFRSGN